MRVPLGLRYVPVDEEPLILPSESEPEAFPAASGTSLAAFPLHYPAPGPTGEGFLYSQLQNATFPGTVNTFTQQQTFAVTNPGETAGAISILITDTVDGTGDPTAIRPAGLVIGHHSTLTPVGGVGASIFFTTQDLARTDVRIGKHAVEITDPTPNACASTQAWSVLKNGTEVECLRIRGGSGMAPTFVAGGSTAEGGAAAGKVGGQVWCRTDFLHSGASLAFYNATPVNKPTVTGSKGANAALISLLTALAALGLVTDSSS